MGVCAKQAWRSRVDADVEAVSSPRRFHANWKLMPCHRPLSERSPSIRTNAICPWFTKTRIAEGVAHLFEEAGLPSNTPEDVAKVVVGVLADQTLSGGTMYVEGGRAWNIEAGLLKTRPEWLGERQTAELDRGTEVMAGGEDWVKNQE